MHCFHDAFGIFLGRLDEAFTFSAFSDVPKDEDHPDDFAPVIVDGCGTVINGSVTAVPRDKKGMIAKPDGLSELDDLPYRLLNWQSGCLI